MRAPTMQIPLPVGFWTDPDVRKMSKQAQGLAAFLLTRPFIPGITMTELALKLGIKPYALRPLFKELETEGLAWVHRGEIKLTGLNRLKHNGGTPP